MGLQCTGFDLAGTRPDPRLSPRADERSVHFPSGETEATFRIGVHKAGEWKLRLSSAHDPYPNDADIQVGSPSTLTFRAVP